MGQGGGRWVSQGTSDGPERGSGRYERSLGGCGCTDEATDISQNCDWRIVGTDWGMMRIRLKDFGGSVSPDS